MHVCVSVSMCDFTRVYICVSVRACVCLCMCMCVCVCVCVNLTTNAAWCDNRRGMSAPTTSGCICER
jgi:hypothetical protein